MPSQSFPKQRRVLKRGDFLGIQRRGRRFSRGDVMVVAAKSKAHPEGQARLGLVVSRKVGNAVQRNKLKRWVREWFRKAEGLPRGVDLVVMPKRGALEKGAHRLWADLSSLVPALATGKLS